MDDDGRVWAPGRRALSTGLVLTITLVAFESLAVATVMPIVERDLGGLGLYGWVFSGFFLASLVGIVATGIVTDRRGPALPFGLGLALFSLGLVGAGAATSMGLLVLARVAQGLGAGAIPAAAYAAVARGYPVALRARVFAVFSTAWVVPGVLGPSLAVLIERAISWRAVFLALLPLVLVAGTMTLGPLHRLPAHAEADETPAAAGEGRARMAGVLVLVGGVAALLAAASLDAPIGVTVLLVGVGLPAALVAFVRVVPAGTVRLAPGLPAVVAVKGILTWAFFGIDAFVALAVTEGAGGSTALAGAVLSVTAVLWTAGSWTQERVLTRLGPRRLDRIAFALLAGSGAGMVLVAVALPAATALLVWGVAGYAMGLGYAPLSVAALGAAAPGREGEASASLQLCDTLGVAVGTGIGGALISLGDARGLSVSSSVALAMAAGTVLAVLGVLASTRLPATVPTR